MGSDATAPLPRLPVLGWRNLSVTTHRPPIADVDAARKVLYATTGRAAILLALEALSIGPGDRVLVPTYHCPTMIAPIVRLGATPLFYPVDAAANVDLAWIGAADLTGVKAMLAVHFFGLPRPMAPVRGLCDERGIALIEDCAHAFFGACDGTPVGGFGHMAITSAPKFFPVNEGGCLIGPRPLLEGIELQAPSALQEVRTLLDAIEIGVSHGRWGLAGRAFHALMGLKRSLRGAGRTARTATESPPDRPETWLDETLLRRRAGSATRWIVEHTDQRQLSERRRANYRLWSEATRGLARAYPLFPELPANAVPYVFPLHVSDPEAAYRALRAEEVPIFRWDVAWSNIPQLPGDRGRAWLTDVFQLGCHQDLCADDVRRLASIVRRVLSAAG